MTKVNVRGIEFETNNYDSTKVSFRGGGVFLSQLWNYIFLGLGWKAVWFRIVLDRRKKG